MRNLILIFQKRIKIKTNSSKTNSNRFEILTLANMQYKRLGVKWFSKVGAPHQLSVTMDRNTVGNPQLFILQDR